MRNKGWTDGWVIKETFIKKEDIQEEKQGPRAFQSFTTQVLFYFKLVSSILECKVSFMYCCVLTLSPEVCDGATCWLKLTMWYTKAIILSYSIQRSYYRSCSITLLDWHLAVSQFQPSLPVVTQWLWCPSILCALSYVWVFYTFLYRLVLSAHVSGRFNEFLCFMALC